MRISLNLRWTVILATGFLFSCGDQEKEQPGNLPFWKEYNTYTGSQRSIDPKGYIEYLKQTRFTHGELDSIPPYAIILHDTRVTDFLDSLDFSGEEIDTLQTGTTDPNVLYVVRSKKQDINFVICSGLPGTGGIATQIAELGAMNVKYLVHIGTCGILGDKIGEKTLIVSNGSYKDGGSVLMSDTTAEGRSEIAFPDSAFSGLLFRQAQSGNVSSVRACGFTVPIFYYQPDAMILRLLNGKDLTTETVPEYIEMEGSAVFTVSHFTKMHTASLQAGTDRYVLKDGKIEHSFMDYDSDKLKLDAIRIAINTFKSLK